MVSYSVPLVSRLRRTTEKALPVIQLGELLQNGVLIALLADVREVTLKVCHFKVIIKYRFRHLLECCSFGGQL